MRQVYLSFLGTNNYLACNYHFPGERIVENVRFVQEAGISLLCQDWSERDKIFIFTTAESHDSNWRDLESSGADAGKREGLKSCLDRLNLQAPCEEISIPSGRSEGEIWSIFNTVFTCLQEGDRLHLDITHAFRSLPMLAMVLLGYSKVVRNVQVETIWYGAMEAIGSYKEVETMPVTDRNVPVFDLLPFDRLQDWVVAIDRFTGTGDAGLIYNLALADIAPILKQSKGQDKDAAAVRNLAKSLAHFSGVIATCRGKEIGASVEELMKALAAVQEQTLIQPLQPLLARLNTVAEGFAGDEYQQGMAAVKWCCEHSLFQQAYTILYETIITQIVCEALQGDSHDVPSRELASQAVKIALDNTAEKAWLLPARDNPEKTRLVVDWLISRPTLMTVTRDVRNHRNDINHCGMNNNAMRTDTIRKNLNNFIRLLTTAPAENDLIQCQKSKGDA